jgi:hypothetical protein
MKTQRVLTALGATLLAATVAATAYSPAASAFNTVDCTYNANNLSSWFNCASSTGTNTIWYVNGIHQSSFDGASSASFYCSYGHTYRISVNTGTSTAASWFGSCDYNMN